MKTLLKIVGAIVVCVVLALVILSITGLDPWSPVPRNRTGLRSESTGLNLSAWAAWRRPGLWLKGDVQNFPADWTFADKYQTIKVETHPWYLIPHSVNVAFVTFQGNLYLHVDYGPPLYAPGRFPSGKSWTAAVARDPRVRLKLGSQVWDAKAFLVADKAEADAVFEAYREKNPKDPTNPHRDNVYFLRVLPG
jgi:hypothetical protein